ncbi:alpha-D-ribose 1-methylphosphonate 5-triphosphate synthase subunit PhnG [Paenochrobactrum gallinarii]|uniref:Alpha-D-ribose 1-methylphosphonate 5-triphosphate synthase subunit PhnG n=1 Tax=Paenochrobactrum gallinarii TaxID=643673 RepID=A0A841LX35_9HYPH|nr:phosphonate C-P lyase system protein PhnG [Paenochrobactrum gallinarii]MBB6261420.1 alpha-D-ribose 1-methylphosphonate 5-triphosphate synthase subunit PhnG [Paenochrobactrum gallinarii]
MAEQCSSLFAGGTMTHGRMLSVLARMPKEPVKAFAEKLLNQHADINVLKNRTGLVMLPMRDTVKSTDFHLGEVLVAEAHIQNDQGLQGYGMVIGRDLEQAMAMAVIDLSFAAQNAVEEISNFVVEGEKNISKMDEDVLRHVEATRVQMETF